MYFHYDNSKPNNPNKEIARLVGFDGGSISNLVAKDIIQKIKLKYDYSNIEERRKGSRFLYRLLKGDELNIDGEIIKADFDQKLNFLINGILYTFRNDRAHGGIISPFRSSKATMKTYAHCSFCFLTGYYLLLALIHFRSDKLILTTELKRNYSDNLKMYKELYGRNLVR